MTPLFLPKAAADPQWYLFIILISKGLLGKLSREAGGRVFSWKMQQHIPKIVVILVKLLRLSPSPTKRLRPKAHLSHCSSTALSLATELTPSEGDSKAVAVTCSLSSNQR